MKEESSNIKEEMNTGTDNNIKIDKDDVNNIDAQITINISGLRSFMNKASFLFPIIGFVLVCVGCFLPFISYNAIFFIGSVALLEGDGIVLILVATVCVLFALYEKKIPIIVSYFIMVGLILEKPIKLLSTPEIRYFVRFDIGFYIILVALIVWGIGVVAIFYMDKQPYKEGDDWIPNKIRAIIIVCIILIALGIEGFAIYNSLWGAKYNNAVSLLNEKKYDDAKKIFEELESFKDSETKVYECQYNKANDYFSNGNYKEAENLYREIADYNDCRDKIIACQYCEAENLLDQNDYESAKNIFSNLGYYSDSYERVKECDYLKAINIMETGKYRDARDIFSTLGDYKESKDYMNDCDYKVAADYYQQGQYGNARVFLQNIEKNGGGYTVDELMEKLEAENGSYDYTTNSSYDNDIVYSYEEEHFYVWADAGDGYASLRYGPGTEYDIICTVPNGTALELIGNDSVWTDQFVKVAYYVDGGWNEGYVASSQVSW